MEWGREKDDSSNENQRVVIQIKVARHCTSKYDWCSLQSKKGKKRVGHAQNWWVGTVMLEHFNPLSHNYLMFPKKARWKK